MKINGDRMSAGFPVEKNDKPSRTPSKSAVSESARFVPAGDELELTGKSAAVFNALREATGGSAESPADELDTIKSKLAVLKSNMLSNPAEALSAHTGLDSETVARLVG